MKTLYPLKFNPIFKEKPWGGQKVKTILGMDFKPADNCGEVWLISAVEGNKSTISEGFLKGNELDELVEVYMGDLVGDQIFENFGNEFPILVKLLDAMEYLSLQVHPDDAYAFKHHKTMGKSEMWYIMDAGKDSELINGFSKPVNRETFTELLNEGRIREILNIEKVKPNEVYYNPPGRIHALGPGILLAEIQQTSDITYRLSDWGRLNKDGTSRELHLQQGLDVLDFKVYPEYRINYPDKENGTVSLLKTKDFVTNLIRINKSVRKDYTEIDSFVILLCLEGAFQVGWDEGHTHLGTGECVLIPNELKVIFITPQPMARILEVFIV